MTFVGLYSGPIYGKITFVINPTEPPTQYSLREFIRLRLDRIEQRLELLRVAISQMANRPVSSQEFEGLKLQVAGLAEATHELEQRVDSLEKHTSTISWVARQVVTVAFIIALVWAIGFLR